MNLNIFVLTAFLCLISCISVEAQDLIDRTRNNTPLNHHSVPNSIAATINIEKANHAFSAVSLFNINQKRAINRYEDYLYDAIFLELKSSPLSSIFKSKPSHIALQVPVTPKFGFELELMRVEVLTSDFVLNTSDGQQFNYDEIPVVFYRGIIKGDPNSTATITVFENEIKGLITDKDGNYVLAPITGQLEEYTLYNDKNLVQENHLQCSTEEDLMQIGANVAEQVENTNRFANCVEVYIECDRATYQSKGNNLNNVQAFVNSLFSEVTTLYANENISIRLSEVFVWTTNDPYLSLNSTSAILEKFADVRRNNYDGRLAHFISTRNLGGGIAWLNVLCANYFSFNADWNGDGVAELHHAGPYAVSTSLSANIIPIPTYSWNVNQFAHEMGHNFGSPHTQKCVWGATGNKALDNCYPTEGSCSPGPTPTNGGTIMSYCHITSTGINFNNGFGNEPGNLIRNNYNGASCNLTCTSASNLPIELLHFSVKASDSQTAMLEWSTGTEINSSHFEIERKAGGKDWKILGKELAVGHSNETKYYQFEDKNPELGENLYRLKQVDLNGDFAFSSIELLTFKEEQTISFNNPVNDILNIRIASTNSKTLPIAILDAQGRVLERRKIAVQEGSNVVDWNMAHLPQGIYFMHVVDESQMMFKLVKM